MTDFEAISQLYVALKGIAINLDSGRVYGLSKRSIIPIPRVIKVGKIPIGVLENYTFRIPDISVKIDIRNVTKQQLISTLKPFIINRLPDNHWEKVDIRRNARKKRIDKITREFDESLNAPNHDSFQHIGN
ncbi:hypothetical protein BEI67_19075 [Photobacterium damselae subsp. piscicida]|nr:hypothetical protein BEI67_19075 [Photobacterium damselae subsp. piscicida]